MSPSFLLKLSISHSRNRPLQSFLLFLGIAIGVAVVIAVDLANESIGRSFRLSTESISGKATHQIIGSETGLEQSLYTWLKTDIGFSQSAPVVTGYVRLPALNNRTLQILGVDPLADTGFRNYLGNSATIQHQQLLSSLLTSPGKVLISKDLAEEINIRTGDPLMLQTATGTHEVEILGLLESSNTFTRQALSGVVLADISVAQEILQLGDRISHIDLIIDPDDPEAFSSLKKQLPAGLSIASAQQSSESIRQMSSSFELNLKALSLLALLVGMFLIYNTITFSVIQRRFQLGTMRALGITKQEVFSLILTETLFWGILGSIAGLLLGIALGTGIIKMVSQTISDLYFTLTVNAFHLSSPQLIKGFLLGLSASLVSAVFPAREAAGINPADALRRSSLEKKITSNLILLTIVGIVTIAAGVLLLFYPSRSLILSFGALLLIVFGSAMLVPGSVLGIMRILGAFFSLLPGITGTIASRNIGRSLSRTGVAVASLMVAVSVIVGVGIMVGSFRTTVVNWLSDTIRADLYIQPGNSLGEKLDANVKTELQAIAGVDKVFSIRTRQIRRGAYANSSLVSLDQDIAKREWLWHIGDKNELQQKFEQGWVFISEPFASKHGIQGDPGSILVLETDRGKQKFKLAGIFRDFSSDQGIVVLQEEIYRNYWQDQSLFGVSLMVQKGVDPEAVRKSIESNLGSRYNLLISSNKGLREAAIEVFDRTFTITIALQILAGLVAFIGVMNTVMSLMLERSREIGILRANGLTITQLWRLVMTESSLIGLLAGLLSIPLGTAMAWILVFIINKRSFGWTLDFVFQPETYLQALSIAVFSAMLAGIYPLISISKKPVAELLQTE